MRRSRVLVVRYPCHVVRPFHPSLSFKVHVLTALHPPTGESLFRKAERPCPHGTVGPVRMVIAIMALRPDEEARVARRPRMPSMVAESCRNTRQRGIIFPNRLHWGKSDWPRQAGSPGERLFKQSGIIEVLESFGTFGLA